MKPFELWESTPSRRTPTRPLSKARVLAGLQCKKRLYLETYEPSKRDPADFARDAILNAGKLVGEVARDRYPGGVTVTQDGRVHDAAVDQTAAALADRRTRAIYEAAFTHDGIRVRVDILARAEDGLWDLVEVKSSSGFKEEYLPDLAVQLHVVEGSGVSIGRVLLLYVNNRYVWEGGPYDVSSLFAVQDLSKEIRGYTPRVLDRIDSLRAVLRATEAPDVAIGPHCRKPYPCPFHGHCHQDAPEFHISSLPRLTPKIYAALLGASIEDIRDIPDGFDGLNELQWRVRDVVRRGEPFAHPDLRQELDRIKYPVHFLDFETCNPVLPIIPGTHPFQQTPFQWSDHVLEWDGTQGHRGYLHEDRSDPLRPLTEALIQALDGEGSIVVYSGFESRVIRSLAAALPEKSEPLARLEARMVDLHNLIHAYYYHPQFHGSFSIKAVLPVLVDGLDYSELAIQEGSQAALAFTAMTDPRTPPDRKATLREGLLAYCRRDTEAMLHLFRRLKGFV